MLHALLLIASLGAHEGDLRGHFEEWNLTAKFQMQDGTEEGVEVKRIIETYPTRKACEKIRKQHEAEAKEAHVELECGQ